MRARRSPKLVHDQCTEWLHQLDEAMPTVVFGLKDDQGADVTGARVLVDGKPSANGLDGRPVGLDPGAHDIRFERDAPSQTVTVHVVLRTGEKNRDVAAVFPAPEVSPAAPPSAPDGSSPSAPAPQPEPESSSFWTARNTASVTILGVGAVGVGLGVLFGVQSLNSQSQANTLRAQLTSSSCPSPASSAQCQQLSNQVDAQNRDALLSDVFYVAGGVLAAGALVTWLAWPHVRGGPRRFRLGGSGPRSAASGRPLRRSVLMATRRMWAHATVACVATAFCVQSCAVMSSSSNCADRADCPDDDAAGGLGGSSSSGEGSSGSTGGGDAEASVTATDDASNDATVADVGSEGVIDGTATDVSVGDVTPDQTASLDARSEDTGVRDVVSEPEAAVDASIDVVTDQGVDAPPDAFDGCIGAVSETCTNGIDDNCDGKIDCGDPQCAGFTCTAPVPAGGWLGPALLWLGASTATSPSCPTGYQTALDAHQGPTGTADTCICACTPSGQACSATGTFHVDQNCQATPGCTSVATSSTSNGACTPLPTNNCGTGGSFEVGGGAIPAPTGGACTATPSVATQGSTPAWTTSARVCAASGPIDSPGGCTTPGDQCVPVSPGAASGFSATLCVYQSGDLACPTDYPNNRQVVFSGEDGSSRGCGACTCTTASPAGGSCAATITVFSNADCSGNTVPYNLGTACVGYNNQSPTDPMSVRASYTVTAGSCTVATQSQPTGSVVGTGPTTVCCL